MRLNFLRSNQARCAYLGGILAVAAISCGGGAGASDVPALNGIERVQVIEDSTFNILPQDSSGWTVFSPSADTQIVYVSSQLGNDAAADVYASDSPMLLGNPFEPGESIKPFKTIDAALSVVRDGYPDWILLRRGDVWERSTPINVKSGRSPSERFLISSYGHAAPRPLIRTGISDGLRFWKIIKFSAVSGLHFYANERNPNDPDFLGFDNVSNPVGISSYAEGSESTATATLLFEDCYFDFYAGNNFFGRRGGYGHKDIILRRNIITNNYSPVSHSTGVFASTAKIFLEGNIFDHNGWYVQANSNDNDRSEGQATFFNHNVYLEDVSNTILRGNLFLRASSMGAKFTANPEGTVDYVVSSNILVENNFFFEGEIGVSIGGNDDHGNGHRWRDILIRDNVLINIGRSRPTDRGLGWGMQISDWEGGVVSGNLFTSFGGESVPNLYGISIRGHMSNVLISSNTMFGFDSDRMAVQFDSGPMSQVSFFENKLQFNNSQMLFVSSDSNAISFSDNEYHTGSSKDPFEYEGATLNFSGWQSSVGDSNSFYRRIQYIDPQRNLVTYMQSLGRPATLQQFIDDLKGQSRQDWRLEYTASAINDYIRAGFTQ